MTFVDNMIQRRIMNPVFNPTKRRTPTQRLLWPNRPPPLGHYRAATARGRVRPAQGRISPAKTLSAWPTPLTLVSAHCARCRLAGRSQGGEQVGRYKTCRGQAAELYR